MQIAVNNVSLEKWDYEIARVKNYCPITIDEDTVERGFADVLVNRSINSRSFLHERPNGKNRLKLMGVLDKLGKQIDAVSSWCGLTIPIEGFSKVYNIERFDGVTRYKGNKLEIINGLAVNTDIRETRIYNALSAVFEGSKRYLKE